MCVVAVETAYLPVFFNRVSAQEHIAATLSLGRFGKRLFSSLNGGPGSEHWESDGQAHVSLCTWYSSPHTSTTQTYRRGSPQLVPEASPVSLARATGVGGDNSMTAYAIAPVGSCVILMGCMCMVGVSSGGSVAAELQTIMLMSQREQVKLDTCSTQYAKLLTLSHPMTPYGVIMVIVTPYISLW